MARKVLNSPHVEISYENVLENGRFVRKAVQREVKDSDKFKDVTCLDFTMDHLQAIGADSKLVDVTGKFGDRTFDSIEALNAHISNIESFIESKNNEDEN